MGGRAKGPAPLLQMAAAQAPVSAWQHRVAARSSSSSAHCGFVPSVLQHASAISAYGWSGAIGGEGGVGGLMVWGRSRRPSAMLH